MSLEEQLENPDSHACGYEWVPLWDNQQKIARAFDEHSHMMGRHGAKFTGFPSFVEHPTLLELARRVVDMYGLCDTDVGRRFVAAVKREESGG